MSNWGGGHKLQPDVMVTYRIDHTWVTFDMVGSSRIASLETRLTHKEQQCTRSPYGLEFAPGEPCQGFWQSLQIKGYVRKGSLSKGDDC